MLGYYNSTFRLNFQRSFCWQDAILEINKARVSKDWSAAPVVVFSGGGVSRDEQKSSPPR